MALPPRGHEMLGGALVRPRLWPVWSRAQAPPAGPGGDFAAGLPRGLGGRSCSAGAGLPFFGIPFPQ